MKQITTVYSRQRVAPLLLGLAACCLTAGSHAVDLANEPLFVTGGIEPNVMYIMDDSGSMMHEVTPDEAFRFGAIYTDQSPNMVFPMVGTLYGNGDDPSVVPTFDDDSAYGARARSPQVNLIYYNPSVTYTPWVKHDGSFYPNADPEQAYHNPARPEKGFRNLTIVNTTVFSGDPNNATRVRHWIDCTGTNFDEDCEFVDRRDGGAWVGGTWVSRPAREDTEFWPATYYWFNGGDEWSTDSFDGPIEIRSSTSTYDGHGRENRTDCTDGVCTYAEEIQNFANWYTYYRSKILSARAGVGQAFVQQSDTMRVGYGTINTNGTVGQGVRAFTDTNKEAFFDWLYSYTNNNSGTPLRKSLDEMGQYYSRSDNAGPYSMTPGENSDGQESFLSCRANYTILMTDGYWSGNGATTNAATGNVDGTSSENAITNAEGDSFTYEAVFPYTDTYSGTLADVAMHYWKNDLMPTLANNVPHSTLNPAFWQHMSVFGVGFGVVGQVDPDDAFAAIKAPEDYDFTWPEPTSRNPATVDDLLHASVNGRGGYFSAGQPKEFAKQLSSMLNTIMAKTEGSASTVAASSTRLGTDTTVFQASFNTDGWTGKIEAWELNEDGSVEADPAWTTEGKISPSNYATRKVFTYNGSSGLAFSRNSWDSMTQAQRDALIGADETVDNAAEGKLRIDWVRGRSDISGMRNDREDLLGDIVNSSPVLASDRSYRFENLPDAQGGNSYETYVANHKKNRADVLYVGANDGMLHAFDAATGNELFSYVPSTIYSTLYDLSLPDYGESSNGHQYSVDGPIFVGDAYFTHGGETKWRNILVGTLGAGGKGIYVLDVTDPASFDASDILFEITADDFPQVGNVLGEPVVAPTEDGWKIIFGNGYNSNDGRAYLFAVDLSSPTGDGTEVIETDAQANNGLSTPSLLMSGDGLVADVYAGDLQGRMWKFDLSGNNWASAYKSGNTPVPLFTARDDEGNVQAITSAPVLGANEQIEESVMVYFGTGRYLTISDNLAGDTVQSVYALVDKGETIHEEDRTTLMEKVITDQSVIPDGDENNAGRIRREVSKNDDTSWWADKDGWYLDLYYDESEEGQAASSSTGERVISKPLLVYDRLIFPTLIPADDPCSPGSSGWLMELVAVGDRYPEHSILGHDGLALENAVMGLSEVLRGGEKLYLPTSDVEGEINVEEGDLPDDVTGRMSWRQLR